MIHPPRASFNVSPPVNRPPPLPRQTRLRFLATVATVAVSVALHAGLLWYVVDQSVTPKPPDAPEMPAAIMITMAPIAVTEKSEVDNVTEGPAAVESAASEPEVLPDPEVPPPPPPPEILPEVPPTPPDVRSEAVLPMAPKIEEKPVEPPPPQEEIKPEPEEPKLEKPPEPVKQVKAEKPVEKPKVKEKPKKKEKEQSVASKAGGGPKSDIKTGDRTSAPSAGSSVSSNPAQLESWQGKVRSKIVRAKRYPAEARKNKETGAALVGVTIGGDGNVSSVKLLASSGSASLDAEAVDVIRRAAPYPPPPDGKPITQKIPINFSRK